MMLFGVSREAMARTLGEALARREVEAAAREKPSRKISAVATPLPLGTVDDYIRRVKDRWEANPLPDRNEARERAIRRNHGLLRAVIGQGDFGSAIRLERHLSVIEGTEMPRNLEVSGPGGAPVPLQAGADMIAMLRKLAGGDRG